ncbi:autotransporter outer membrane beta-barrel domain-containing protein [Methylomonas methanica]|uniref:Outer membrane autotransporter barrel domain protein n=1 Tax=Methylomonas methanica (strain DSM 25384 / MC09) TaxID=857087 RepID=F9ZZN5_METMM|nr:autotransporter outer membrane beta-barrel domain-containing protein [Methylomonas methanica]AEF98694.1 outer membrane autotransporter barrel domain protein [Methylomonas methanica MC09]
MQPKTEAASSIVSAIGEYSALTHRFKNCFISVAYLALLFTPPGQAQTLDEQIGQLLAQGTGLEFCAALVGNDPRTSGLPDNFGPQLQTLCGLRGVGGGPGGGPGQTAFSGAALSSLGQADQFVKKRRQRAEEGHSSNGGGAASGAASDAEVALTSNINLFFNADYRELDRRQTVFEPGYQSNQKGFTLGLDVMPTDWLLAGLAFNYSHWRGDQHGGGGFETDSYGPTVFASLFPWPGFFADLSFQYLNKQGTNSNQRNYTREDNTRFGGSIAGTPGADQYEGNLIGGFDYAIGGLTIGPRATVRYRRANMDSYIEQGNSGLELRFMRDSLTSVQSSLGAQASYAISTGRGVLVPQLNADWTHEFANGQRSIFVQFAQDNRPVPTTFSFQTDRPDRDFFHLGAGLVAILPNGWQAFVNFETLLGHAYFDNYIGTMGFRLGL